MKKEIKFSIDIVYPFPKKVKYIKISVYKKMDLFHIHLWASLELKAIISYEIQTK